MGNRLLLGAGLALIGLLAVASPASASTTCNGTLTGSYGSVVVPTWGSCTLSGATVTGGVTVNGGAYFEASGTSVGGTVSASGAVTVYMHDGSSVGGSVSLSQTAQLFLYGTPVGNNVVAVQSVKDYGSVQVCGANIKGNLKVKSMGEDVLLGDADSAASCAGNTVGGSVYAINNNTWTEMVVSANKITGSLTANKNKGIGPKSVDHNLGGVALACSGNVLPFVGSPNFGFATHSGQCS